MEHEPIRVGQVREMPYAPRRYVVVGLDGALATVVMNGAVHEWFQFTMHRDPVVGWSREYLPPPVLTANPAEVVEGEVRLDNDTTYQVRGFDNRGRAAISHLGHSVGACRWLPDEIAHDPLISRPGVTL